MAQVEITFPIGITEVSRLLGVYAIQIKRLIESGVVTPKRDSSRRNQEAYSFSLEDFQLLQRIFMIVHQDVSPKEAVKRIQREDELKISTGNVASAIALVLESPTNSSISLLIESISGAYEVESERLTVRKALRRKILNRD